MAVVYFTSNASTGAGSLSEAIQNAQPGDVVRPDEAVFERGSTIEIALASTLTIDKNLTLDASPFRVRLDGGGATRCVVVATGVNVNFTSLDFIGGVVSQNGGNGDESGNGGGLRVERGANVVLSRCRVCGCDAARRGGGIYVDDAASLTLADSAVFGNRAQYGGGVYVGDDAAATLSGATVCGNVGHDFDGETSTSALAAVNSILGNAFDDSETSGSVVDVASSSVGFVASPPDDLSVETWDANAWRNWDLRLLDDASPNPSPYRDAGDIDAATQYDFDGNFRGRETNGVATRSPGAYETLQADLFWVGVDASGAEVVSPSFLTSDGWAASRFATVSGDAAPQVGQTLFVGRDVAFVDVLATSSNQKHGLYVGGGTVVAFESDARLFLGKLQIAANARLAFNRGAADSSRFGAFSRVDGVFTTFPNAVADDNVYIASAIVYGTVISEPTYGTLNVLTSIDVSVERMSGVYVCNAFRIQQNGTRVGQTIIISDGTTIHARSVNFGSADAANYVESFFSRPVTLKLQGAASVSMPSTTRESWADDFVVDVTDATSATLTLCGQTVCGGAPTSEITLNGVAQADARGLDVASLALTADASLSVNGGSAKAATLILAAGSILTLDGGKVCVAELSVADGATVAFSPVEPPDATDGANVIDETNATDKTIGINGTDATCVDAVLSATTSATVGAATFTGVGYFATPPGTDLTAATFAATIRRVDYCAEVKAFAATATGPTTATIVWSATDATARVCVERENAAAPNGWEVVATTPTEDASPLEVALSGKERFRIFDGQTFYVDAAWFPTGDFYVYVADSSVSALAAERSEWAAITQTIKAGGAMGYRNENIMFMAQVKNRLSGGWLAPSDVVGITATVCRVYENGFAPDEWVPVDGWEGVAVPTACVLEAPTANDAWTADAEGPNFVWVPDVRERAFFPTGGKFATQLRFDLTDGRNPIYLTFVDEVD